MENLSSKLTWNEIVEVMAKDEKVVEKILKDEKLRMKLAEKHSARIEVLNRTKQILLLSKESVLTIQQVADLYNTEVQTVSRCAGIRDAMFSRRDILELGMFLSNNEIAKEVRTQLLNTEAKG
ncbi:hypothetical protein [Bacillus toyonensis]|uniref:Uncharacterized protein n=1 Tax=Bacillus toyonensis TaxID=155322 RepID=A0ABX6G2M8_9BACI|nr:hypothetical protein [Bacillus toyonensis]MED2737888.1 hypothetical protein [Bacillus toyonensis]QHA15994.1 hypothetical protein GPA05_02840 [Bacillus toyonensis]